MYLTTNEAADRLGLSPHTLRVQVGKGSITAERIKGDYVFHEDEIERYRHVSLGRQGFASARHPGHVAARTQAERDDALAGWGRIVDFVPKLDELVRALSSPFADEILAASPAKLRWIHVTILHLFRDGVDPMYEWLNTLLLLHLGLPIEPEIEQVVGPPPGPDAPDPPPIIVSPPRRRRRANPKPAAVQTQQSAPPPTLIPGDIAAGADAADR